MLPRPLLEKLKQHSRRVLITKRSLPVFAFLIAAMIIVWPMLNQTKDKFSLAVPDPNKKGAMVEMENLKFFGLNEKNLQMTLRTPQVKDEENDIARMITPTATYQMKQGDEIILKSPYALINQKKQTIFFEDRISGKSDSGYTVNASQVLCDYNLGTADSDSPVKVTGPLGKINAQGIWMADRGDLILFKKKATAQIKNKKENIDVFANNGIQINQVQKTITATEQAKIQQNNITLKADKIILYYTDSQKDRIKKLEAFGNVSLDNKKQTITGNEADYNPITKIAHMKENVVLTQKGHNIKGDKATINMATGKSDLNAKKRITGQLIPSALKGEKK